MKKPWRKILMALGVLYLLVSLTLPISVRAKNLTAQQEEIPCFANPNPSLVIALRKNGGNITFDFGLPYGGYLGLNTDHQGIDLGMGKSFDVFAVYGGTITRHEWTDSAGGVLEWRLDSPYERYVVKYYHQDIHSGIWPTLDVGVHIDQGQAVGVANGSGKYTDGPHLHLQLEFNRSVADPKPFLLCGQGLPITYLPGGIPQYPDLPLSTFDYQVSVDIDGHPTQLSIVESTPTQVTTTYVVPTEMTQDYVLENVPLNGTEYHVKRRELVLSLIVVIGLIVLTSLFVKFPSTK